MSADERAHFPHGGKGLLRGSRAKSYGSLVQSSVSPVRQRRIEHQVQPGETLQGLALKYGVSMEQIKRANRLYTNDSIFLKTSLSIPMLSDCAPCGDGAALATVDSADAQLIQGDDKKGAAELSPMDFLKKMDGLISQSKQAAVEGCQEGEKRFAALEAACNSSMPDRRRLTRSQSALSSPRMHQQSALVAVPLTVTKYTKKLRESEDDIFEL